MSDFKPNNTKHILQDMKGQVVLTSTVMLSCLTGAGLLSYSDLDTQAISGIQSSIESIVTEAPQLASAASQTLNQFVENISHQYFTAPFEATEIHNAPRISTNSAASLNIEAPKLVKLSSNALFQNIDQSKATLSTTAMLGSQASPFASYGTASSQIKNKAVASLAEIKEFFELKHEDYSYVEHKYFLKNVKEKLPKYRTLFKKAAQKNDLDWRLVASIAYQESVWDPKAVSPTGVKGMMMLTRITAKEMNVRNRTNTAESISGGAAYFKKLVKRIPKEVTGADRTLMALSAYNMGYGHLIAARQLTERQNADSTKWSEVKKRIPLLQQKKYYSQSRYGYAGGARQAIHYVAEIQKHYDMLLMMTEKKSIAQGQVSRDGLHGFAIARYSKS